MSWLERFLARFGAPAVEPRAPSGDPERVAAVLAVLGEIEPLVAADGGHIALLGTHDGLVFVELAGACAGCSASDLTLEGVLEPRLRSALPWFGGLRVDSQSSFVTRGRHRE